MESSSTVLSY